MRMSRRSAFLALTAGGVSAWALAQPSALAQQYTYDALGRLCSVTYPDGSSVTYAYDAAGNRTQVARAGLGSGFSQIIQIAGAGPANLRALANSAGYNGAQNATIAFVVGDGVTVSGTAGAAGSAGGAAIDTGTWPTGSYAITLAVVVENGGIVSGGGGGGSGGGGPFGLGLGGGAGGDAIYCRLPIAVIVQCGGALRGGGGGGGGGGAYVRSLFPEDVDGGGGGGGGAPNGAGGPGGSAGADGGSPGAAGGAGTSNGGGPQGGGGGSAGGGGPGGTYATAGGVGEAGFPNPASGGGAAGYAIRKNGHAVSVTNTGAIAGAIG